MVKGGKRFIPNKIKVIVTNPIYKGIIRHKGVDYQGEHQGLVSAKLWQEANAALGGRERKHQQAVLSRNTHQTLLKGLIHCGECGHLLTPKPGGKKDKNGNPYLYYTCNNVSKDGSASTCSLRNVPARAMDDFVVQILGEIGRRPEIIQAALDSSNAKKGKGIRPLKTELAKLQRQHAELSGNLLEYMDLAKKSDSSYLEREALAAAEDLAEQKHKLELEMEKVKISIACCERTVADEHRVAKNLLEFGRTITSVTFDEQYELLRLLLRQLQVKRIDPEKERIDANPHTWNTRMRTSWYSVNLELFANGLLSMRNKNATAGSQLEYDGGESGI